MSLLWKFYLVFFLILFGIFTLDQNQVRREPAVIKKPDGTSFMEIVPLDQNATPKKIEEVPQNGASRDPNRVGREKKRKVIYFWSRKYC